MDAPRQLSDPGDRSRADLKFNLALRSTAYAITKPAAFLSDAVYAVRKN